MLKRIAVVAIGLLLVAGCTTPTNDGRTTVLTLEEAKAEVFAELDRIAAAMPDGALVSRRSDTAPLMRCGDGRFWWSGGMDMSLPDGLSSEEILASVRVLYAEDSGWLINDDPVSPVEVAADFSNGGKFDSPDALSVGVAVIERSDGTRLLSVTPKSRCFVLEDYDPFLDY